MSTTTPPAPSAPAAPAAPTGNAAPSATIPKGSKLEIASGVVDGANRILIYGSGGIGKSYLAGFLPSPLFLDLQFGTRQLNVSRDTSVRNWMDLRGKLVTIEASPPAGLRSIVIDTGTEAQAHAESHVVATRKTEKGHSVRSIDDFGWGRGWQFVFDEWNGLLADCDRLIERRGINVCFIAHAVSSIVPNPGGEDFLRWEPHLAAGDKKNRASIRDRMIGWADHVLFIGYDVNVEDGKGQGTGSRTIYTGELPTHVAKSRKAQIAATYTRENASSIWTSLGIVN